MKKYLFMTLLAMVMCFSAGGVFAQVKNSPVQESIAGSVPEGEHINAFRVDKIIDSGVINLEGKPIGTIDDLVIEIDTGRIAHAVLEFSGFMGLGDKLFAIPWQSLSSVPAEGIFILDQTKAKLEKAPGFDKDNWPDVGVGIRDIRILSPSCSQPPDLRATGNPSETEKTLWLPALSRLRDRPLPLFECLGQRLREIV